MPMTALQGIRDDEKIVCSGLSDCARINMSRKRGFQKGSIEVHRSLRCFLASADGTLKFSVVQART